MSTRRRPKRTPRPGIDEYGRTPLWYHALRGELDAARAAIAAGAAVNAGDDAGYTPLHAAVQDGQLMMIDLLLASGADPNVVDEHGNGPLWVAVLSAPRTLQVRIIRRLLRAGAQAKCPNRRGKSPYDLAMEIQHGLEQPFLEQPVLEQSAADGG
jgi:ankyrin repeat protein